jgi:hypothetical protein
VHRGVTDVLAGFDQKQAHDEIMGHLIDSTEIAGRDQKILEKQIERIEKHLGLPPLK